MTDAIGHIEALYRYPVKSMAGAMLETAELGWHGLAGDRRFAFRRVQDQSAFPWLTASRLPALILYQPEYQYQPDGQSSAPDAVPTHIRTPAGNLLPFAGEALNEEITDRFSAPVQLMQLKQGVFDETPISIITTTTMHKIAAESGTTADIRRFRPNIVLHLDSQNHSPKISGWAKHWYSVLTTTAPPSTLRCVMSAV
ncbi:MAG: MOSC N-terminal beta barrel domain-containing protein [Anaerolineae bacterium]